MYRNKTDSATAEQGFTLLEVLVALAVVAIALGALLASAGTQTRSAAALQDRVFAHWVAMNRATELQLQATAAPAGTSRGQADMAGRQWHWQATIETTEDPNVDRVRIQVSGADDRQQPLSTLTGFLYRTQDAP